ncbi:DNA/RNA non-specific endonuclease [Enterococcus sp. AD013-P3]|uniref:DNA/RNA non-specific endonuclease n=1 Tax=Enterococcus sp. AD013-P3 TaxID=3411036 RepID=UPI003B9264FB
MKKIIKQTLTAAALLLLLGVAGCEKRNSSDQSTAKNSTETTVLQESTTVAAKSSEASADKTPSTTSQSTSSDSATDATKTTQQLQKLRNETLEELAVKDYSGTQTIEINGNRPFFSDTDLSTKAGSWEKYGELDHLNRVTTAEALLNQDLMPTEKRGDISSVTPTGWKNKKINGAYLFNRSHLIGYALAGENANWKNLFTGTRQLNSPEMLRYEMDIKYYLEKSSENYVRYRVTPIFRENELVARGVQMEGQSIGSDAICFNVYIFNIQDGVTLNYADGSSTITSAGSDASQSSDTAPSTSKNDAAANTTEAAEKQYVDENGKGLIKGSKSKIYHIPGSKHYEQTTNPKAWFKTVKEAEESGYRAPKDQ